MALFPNAKYVNDGSRGSNGLSTLSAKAVQNRERFENHPFIQANKKIFGTPEERAELLPQDYRDAVAQLEAEGMSHTMASIIAGAKENIERLSAVPDGPEAVAEAIAEAVPDDPEPTYSGSGKVQAKPIIYSDWSDAAKYFGMDQATAYAEHMANTAHQREVADLRAAGLNPVLGLGSGSSGVTGHTAASGGGSSSSAKKTDENTLLDVIGATVGFLISLKYGASAGNHASKAATGLGRLFGNK